MTVSKTGTGSGTVTSAPGGINCGLDCLEVYATDTVVTLHAVAATGSTFTGWSDPGCTGTGDCVVTMDAAKSVAAEFTQDEYTLTVNIVGNGAVAKDPDQLVYTYGDLVELTATPDSGWSFAGWSGDLISTDNPDTITMDGDKTVTATFTQDEYTLIVVVVGNGTVAKDPDQLVYHYGDQVDLTATPDAGWFFAGWSGGLTGTDNPDTITMDGDKTVTATFTAITYKLYLPLIFK